MKLERKAERRWEEPARLCLAAAWIVLLTLICYYQVLYLYTTGMPFHGSLAIVSAIARTMRSLWYVSLFPAVASGLAWYVFLHRAAETTAGTLQVGARRRATVQQYAMVCTPLFLLDLSLRISIYDPMIRNGVLRASARVFAVTYDARANGPFTPLLEWQAVIGAVAVAVIALQGWGTLPRLDGSRRRFSLLLGAALLSGWGVDRSGLLERLPSPVPRAILEMDREAPLVRGLLLGDRRYDDEAQLAVSAYFETHDRDGFVVPREQLRRSELPDWSPDEIPQRACELCLLPGTPLWTTNGLPFRLRADAPASTEPGTVIEVPRGADVARVYAPRDRALVSIPVMDVSALSSVSDWVVLKIDFAVPMNRVSSLLSSLRERGVRRVDLAVVPFDLLALPDESPLLESGGTDSGPAQEFRLRAPTPYDRPPFRFEGGGPGCPSIHDYEYVERGGEPVHDLALAVSGRARIRVPANTMYGEFIGLLRGPLAGGATTIELALDPPQASPP